MGHTSLVQLTLISIKFVQKLISDHVYPLFFDTHIKK